MVILADHGNSDFMITNEDGSPNTQHTTNPCSIYFGSKNIEWNVEHGKFGDIAPTMLTLMGIKIPTEMIGNIIIQKK